MKKDYTYIALVCDRSGSMAAVQSDAEGALNQFVKDQKAVPGEATLRLVEFDAPVFGVGVGRAVEDWYRVVFHGNLQDAPHYALNPRGGTALLDAVGMTITSVGEELAAKPEDERPEHVIFVVQTDGQENSSRDWQLDRLREAIKDQEGKWNWQFVFLGMGPDTYAQGHAMGMSNVTRSAGTAKGYTSSYANTSRAATNLRTGVAQDMAGANVTVDEEGTVTETES